MMFIFSLLQMLLILIALSVIVGGLAYFIVELARDEHKNYVYNPDLEKD